MHMLIALALTALIVGIFAGWMLASHRRGPLVHRALAERDLAMGERQKAERAAADMQRRVELAQQAAARAETKATEAERVLASHAEMRQEIENAFTKLAQQAVQGATERLVQMNKQQVVGAVDTKKAEIEALLTPVREMLEGYRGEILKSEQARNAVYGGLQEQLKSVLSAQEAVHREASRLTNALQSPTIRGSWGESSLKRCVELAGMVEWCDFASQKTFFGDEGQRLRPDLIVRLPNKRVIAIDAKVPLTDYTLAANETDDARRREHLAQHVRTVRRHIDSLARREYQASIGDTLDFVVLFVPGEHFLSAALVTDPTLFDHAADRKIYLASPTVLLPLLRAVNAGWKAEKTEENAKKMHDAGVELFNRFVKVMEHIANVGGSLAKTVEQYNNMIRSIDTRLWPKGEELQRMSGNGKDLGEMKQIEAIPLESSKLRLTTQGEEPGDVVKIG
jgi:DNA recombination protein RmuC